jgi:hypothetical protein
MGYDEVPLWLPGALQRPSPYMKRSSRVVETGWEWATEWAQEPADLLPSRGGVASNSQNSPLVKQQAPFRNAYKSEKDKYMVMDPEVALNQEQLFWW